MRSDGFSIDTVQPTSPTITATAGGHTYNGQWVSGSVSITVSGAKALSGVDYYEYRTTGDSTWTKMPACSGAVDSIVAHKINDTITINDQTATTYFFRAIGNSGIVGVESSCIVKIDGSSPKTMVAVTGTANDWTNQPVTFTVSSSSQNTICPVSFWMKTNDGDWTRMTSNTYTFATEMNVKVQFKSVSDAGIEDIDSRVYSVQIDKSIPTLTGADNNGSYFIGRTIVLADAYGEIGTFTYTRDGGDQHPLTNGGLLSLAGNYIVTVTDKAGNAAQVVFTVKAIPTVSEIKYTDDSNTLISQIRSEFTQHGDLPDSYVALMGNQISELEARYSYLSGQVADSKKETADIHTLCDKLSPSNNGLLAMENQILAAYNKIAGTDSVLTAEQKAVLEEQKTYLASLLDTIKTLKDQEKNISDRVSAISSNSNGLISQRGTIGNILADIAKMTAEQQKDLAQLNLYLQGLLGNIDKLQSQIDDITQRILNIPTNADGLLGQEDTIKGLLNEISGLTDEQRAALTDKIASLVLLSKQIDDLKLELLNVEKVVMDLPAGDISSADVQTVEKAKELYDSLTKEQKKLVSQKTVESLTVAAQAVIQQQMTDTENGVSVKDASGAPIVNPDMRIMVVRNSAKTDAITYSFVLGAYAQYLKSGTAGDKELLAVYTISLLSNGVAVEPNGDMSVTISIPEGMQSRTGLDVVRIDEDGTVTPMHATRDGDNLVFTTSHFSKYAIVANDTCLFGICKALGIYEADNGICVDIPLIFAAIILTAGTVLIITTRKNRKNRKQNVPVRTNL